MNLGKPAKGSPAPLSNRPASLKLLNWDARSSLPYQQTRVQTTISQAGSRLQRWSSNPWRRLSLLLVVLLISFVIGVGLGTITGVLDQMDVVAAMICVVVLEVSVRTRRALRESTRHQLLVQLLDMARIGLLYGLLLEGFKLL